MLVEASITGKRQITIPKDLYNEMNLKNTDKLVFSMDENGKIVVSKKEINNLDVCPICNREVLKEDVMVIKEFQKYHEMCWSYSKSEKNESLNHVANKLSRSQEETLSRIEAMKKDYKLELVKQLRDNEVVIDVPIKITFMESKKNVVGSVSCFDLGKIMECNQL